MAGLSVLIFVVALWRVPESLPVQRRQQAHILSSYRPIWGLLTAPRYLFFMLAFALSFGVMISYISASPFVGQVVLDMPALLYAFGFSASGTSMVLGNVVNARIAPRVGPLRMLAIGLAMNARSRSLGADPPPSA